MWWNVKRRASTEWRTKGKGSWKCVFFYSQLFPLSSRQLFSEYKHKFLLGESLHLCLLPSGFNTGVYCRASSPCMAWYQHHFIWCLRPSRCLTSRDLPSLLISVAFLELTFLLRWRNKKLKCLQQKDLPAGWRSSSQPRQKQCQRLGKREVLWPLQVLWKTTASLRMTLENPFWQPETAEVKSFATVLLVSEIWDWLQLCLTEPSTFTTQSVVLVLTPLSCPWKRMHPWFYKAVDNVSTGEEGELFLNNTAKREAGNECCVQVLYFLASV